MDRENSAPYEKEMTDRNNRFIVPIKCSKIPPAIVEEVVINPKLKDVLPYPFSSQLTPEYFQSNLYITQPPSAIAEFTFPTPVEFGRGIIIPSEDTHLENLAGGVLVTGRFVYNRISQKGNFLSGGLNLCIPSNSDAPLGFLGSGIFKFLIIL